MSKHPSQIDEIPSEFIDKMLKKSKTFLAEILTLENPTPNVIKCIKQYIDKEMPICTYPRFKNYIKVISPEIVKYALSKSKISPLDLSKNQIQSGQFNKVLNDLFKSEDYKYIKQYRDCLDKGYKPSKDVSNLMNQKLDINVILEKYNKNKLSINDENVRRNCLNQAILNDDLKIKHVPPEDQKLLEIDLILDRYKNNKMKLNDLKDKNMRGNCLNKIRSEIHQNLGITEDNLKQVLKEGKLDDLLTLDSNRLDEYSIKEDTLTYYKFSSYCKSNKVRDLITKCLKNKKIKINDLSQEIKNKLGEKYFRDILNEN